MALLVLRNQPGVVFICGIEGWLQSSDEKQQWQHMVTRVVQYAFESRPVTFITVAPQPWSIGHSIPNPFQLKTNQGKFLINGVDQCSNELLAEIAESDEFHRGLLWLAAAGAADVSRLPRVIMDGNALVLDPEGDVFEPGPNVSKTEMLLLVADAHVIHWSLPGRDVDNLEAELLDMMQRFRWRLSQESRNPRRLE